MRNKVKIFILIALSVSVLLSCNTEKLQLIAPSANIVLSNNTPVLRWSKFDCDYYKVSIDGIVMDSISPDIQFYVPFPLSFGKHQWQIAAYTGKKVVKSAISEFVIDDLPLQQLPENALLLRSNWKIQSSYMVNLSGAELSGKPLTDTSWYAASVPVTVLSALVRNGVYPNPYTGMNNMKIPDSDSAYNRKYDLLKFSHIKGHNPWRDAWWFCTSFTVPETMNGKQFWLNLNEINYRAQIWLNGKLLGDASAVFGMDRKFRFDVTPVLNYKTENHLAIAIYPVDVPGEPANEPLTPLSDPGQNMGDGKISTSYTKWDAMGWDWQPAIRDRDMGITEDVFLTATGSIDIEDVYVSSGLNLPDTTIAHVGLSGVIANYSKLPQSGKLKTTISYQSDSVSFIRNFSINPNDTFSFYFDEKSVNELLIKNPKLWWPVGYGNPDLYNIKIEAVTQSGEKSVYQTHFGIRQIETYIGTKERVFKINGREIYLKGGNWVIDMMLNWNASRYEDEILLTKNSGLNIFRIWGPTGAPPTAFYDAADKNGILLWQDFLNDFWGTFKNTPGYTPPDEVFHQASIQMVKKYRNHPSLIMWCGGNEGPNPREKWITEVLLPKYDGRDSKYYLKQSDGDGLHGGGPYHTMTPVEYFTHHKLCGFSSEIGPSGIPVYESLLKFMPDLGKDTVSGFFPLDKYWAYHDATNWPGTDTRKFTSYHNQLIEQYHIPDSVGVYTLRKYLDKTQLINYDVYRAAIESINRQIWSNASGILLWKSNSSWPSTVWQLYDWYLQAHAGFYAVKLASEPVHIQLNRSTYQIDILNIRTQQINNAKLNAVLYDAEMNIRWKTDSVLNLLPNTATATPIKVPVDNKLCFLKLKLSDSQNLVLSENFYWLSAENDYRKLDELAEPQLNIQSRKSESPDNTSYSLTIENTGKVPAIQIQFKIQGEKSGVELLPTFWTQNFVNLLPGEKITINAVLKNRDITEKPVLAYKAYNSKMFKIIP